MRKVMLLGLSVLVFLASAGTVLAADPPYRSPEKQCRVWKNVKAKRFERPQFAIRTCGAR